MDISEYLFGSLVAPDYTDKPVSNARCKQWQCFFSQFMPNLLHAPAFGGKIFASMLNWPLIEYDSRIKIKRYDDTYPQAPATSLYPRPDGRAAGGVASTGRADDRPSQR
jgi:hypothetical protein